jgi:hypothetical protein
MPILSLFFLQGGAPVWFPNSHIINPPRIFEHLYRLARTFLSESAYKGTVVHSKADCFDMLQRDHVGRKYLPDEFGGDQGRDSPIFLQYFYNFSIFFLNRF